MALYPAPSPSRAEPTLQPSYFTSSLYVESLRTDIEHLVSLYQEQYKARNTEPPFSVFKTVWRSQGWHFLHLRVFDDRTRERFLNTTFRLILEKSTKSEPLFTRVTAVLALYTLYSTQPLGTTPALWHLKHMTIPVDQYHDLQELDATLSGTELSALRPTVSFILKYLRKQSVFLLLPDSSLFSENPRSLPREIHVDRGLIASLDPSSTKKKGRPTRNDKTRKAKSAVDSLEGWLDKTQPLAEHPPALTQTKADEYQFLKSQLLIAIDGQNPDSEGHSAIVKANQLVLQRLQEVQAYVPQASDSLSQQEKESASVGRVGSALEDLAQGLNTGILGLLEGSGNR